MLLKVWSVFQVLAIGRNATALERLAALDTARVVPVILKPGEAALTSLKAALGQHEVGQCFRHICRGGEGRGGELKGIDLADSIWAHELYLS